MCTQRILYPRKNAGTDGATSQEAECHLVMRFIMREAAKKNLADDAVNESETKEKKRKDKL